MSKSPILQVAINAPLSRLFDYLPPADSALPGPGCREQSTLLDLCQKLIEFLFPLQLRRPLDLFAGARYRNSAGTGVHRPHIPAIDRLKSCS